MVWLGIEPEVMKRPSRSIDLLKSTTFSLLRENIARRLATEIDNNQQPAEQLFRLAISEPKLKDDILKGIAAALKGRKKTPVPENWQVARRTLTTNATSEIAEAINTIGIAFRDPQTIVALRQTVEDVSITPKQRARALEQLLYAHPGDLGKLLRSQIRDPELGLIAIRGLAAYSDAETPSTLLDTYPQLRPEQKVAAIGTLAARVGYAERLVDALERKRISASDVSAVQVRLVMAHNKPTLNARLRAIWGDARITSNDKRKLINTLRATLTPALAQADLQNGKALFTKQCATCHTLFGQGAKIGPDLTGSDRKNIEYLLENIVDPSAIVPAAYRVHVVVLANGQVLTGIIREQNDKSITVETTDGRQTIDRQNIDDMTASEKSLMPDGLLQPLDAAQIRDLIEYVMSNG